MDYNQSIEYIKSNHKFGSKLGLDRMLKLLELMGNPHKYLKCIHIAGTNGKGSTTAMISNILIKQGYKVGMYTSPYIEEFEERIQVNNKNIDKIDLSKIITKISSAVNQMLNLGYDNPTEFEIITLAMFCYFYNQNVDFAVIEVGLGGRFDATNVINPILSIITSISYDHTKVLGDTLSKIAYEKAGIIKKAPVILYSQKKEVELVIEKICTESGVSLIKTKDKIKKIESFLFQKNSGTQNFNIQTYNDKYMIKLPLLGEHQIYNASLVILAIEELRKIGVYIENKNIILGLNKVKWPARLEIITKNPLTVIDGAHNIDGIINLRKSLDIYFKYNNLILIIGILKDKQVEDMINIISKLAKKVIIVTPNSDRALDKEKFINIVEKYCIDYEYCSEYNAAYQKALNYCGIQDLILICGSLYMVGDMRKIIKSKQIKAF